MPTKHPRHAITETPRVEQALRPLRDRLAGERVDLSELVVLGAGAKLAMLEEEERETREARSWLAERVRGGEALVDPEAAKRVRRSGWAR